MRRPQPDPDRYSQRSAFCDVLVIGAGRSGLSTALEAAEAGQRVILVEQDRRARREAAAR